MKIHHGMMVVCVLFPGIVFAENIICPGSNFNQATVGMSPEAFIQTCGAPDVQKEAIVPNENIPQVWTYYVPQAVYMGGSQQMAQGTMKVEVAFNDKGQAENINANGIAMGQSMICGSNAIGLGNTKDQIKNVCGKPRTIIKETPEDNPDTPRETKVVEFTYTSTSPNATYVFENGKLVGKK